jgi:hypothetical protein
MQALGEAAQAVERKRESGKFHGRSRLLLFFTTEAFSFLRRV